MSAAGASPDPGRGRAAPAGGAEKRAEKMQLSLSVIAAMAANRVIGAGNRLPWHLPADLRHFKRLTLGHCLIMGRKTWESIGRPLPGRTTVVLTRRPGYAAPGAVVVHSLPAALAAARAAGDGEAFIAGGAEVYRQALGLAGRLYLTLIHRELPGDATFPALDPGEWRLVGEERHDEHDGEAQAGAAGAGAGAELGAALPYSFLVYERRRGASAGAETPGGESAD
jgi:dihydrofolate reductase